MKGSDLRAAVCLLLLLSSPAAAIQGDARIDKMGREVTERAAKDMKSKDALKRLRAVASLSSWKLPLGTQLLIQGLADVDDRIREESARSLGTYGKEAEPARPALLKALDDHRPTVASQAAEALEKALEVSEKELAPARLRLLESGDRTDKFLAARSLVGHAVPLRLVEPILDYVDAQFPGMLSLDYKTRDASRNNIEIGEAALQRLVKTTKDKALVTAPVDQPSVRRSMACGRCLRTRTSTFATRRRARFELSRAGPPLRRASRLRRRRHPLPRTPQRRRSWIPRPRRRPLNSKATAPAK